MHHPSILSCGEMLWDHFPEGPRFGGAPANFACHARRHGGRVTMLSAVGDDARGHEATEILRRFDLIHRSSKPSPQLPPVPSA